MATTAPLATAAEQRVPSGTPPRRQVVGAWLLGAGLALGVFGLVWDIEWHTDVGPDTFFTAPHLMIYASQAVVGLTSLVVVLLHTLAVRRDLATDTPTLKVLGTFHAPLPFLVAGIGAAAGLLYGLGDLWWHTIYGFDVTPTSPPHVAMSLCDLATASGVVMAMAALRGKRSGRWGLVASAALVIGGWTFLLYSTPELLPGLPGFVMAMPALCVLVLVAVAGTIRQARWVLAAGLAFAVLHAATFVWAPAITTWYAHSLDLAMRDFSSPQPSMPYTYPFALLLAALVVAGLMWLARRRNLPPRWAILAIGAIGGLVVFAGYLIIGMKLTFAAIAVVAVLSALFALLGWHLAALLRRLAPSHQREM